MIGVKKSQVLRTDIFRKNRINHPERVCLKKHRGGFFLNVSQEENMKHTFSRFLSAGLVLGALMAIISCSNVLDASLKDPLGSSADSGKMPVLYVTASVGSPSRTILPSDWTEERASALVYQITDDDDSDAVIADKLTYAELKAGLTLYLEVKTWNLTLTGYEPAADGTSADSTKPVLSAKATKDLSAGAAAVTFNLKPAASTQAKGDADVSVTFYDIDELDHIVYGLFDASNAGAGQVDAETVTKNTGSWNGVAGVSESNSATNQWKITYTTDTADAGGDSFFGMIFYNAGNKVLATYFDSIKIDAGNVSKATIKLEKDIYNTSPVAPDNFDLTQTIFNNGTGYQILDGTTTAADTLYKAVFTWEDKSDNETGFVIEITGGTAPLEIDSSATTQTDIDLAAAGDLADGSLAAGSTTATVWLETGKTYTATIKAVNSIGESDTVDCVDTEINLFTVTYQLDEGKVKYGAADTDATDGADQTAFVLPYNKNADVQPLLGADTADIPHVFKDGYQFQEWQDTASLTPGPGTPVAEIAAGNADNMDVTAVWQKALTVNVTLPSYAEAQSVQLLDTYSEAAVITKPKTEPSVEVSAATPTTGGTLNNVVYTVYNIDGTTPVTAGVVDNRAGKLTWTFADTTGLTAGVYRIYVTANYTGTDTTVTPLSGNLYIKITE